ncbi:MAG: hypothetical protein EBR82_79720 [Caulobacteraceae bacterium]|nr:hypothetical protein [Caulobacteraceae bacterium]
MTQSKLRLNTDIRKKIGSLILSHFENEKTPALENYKTAKEDITTAYNTAFKIASNVVGRAYPKNDVATLQSFKKKYGNACDVVAKDSCFYFANTEMPLENERENNEHFDFKLDANMSGRFDSMDFGIAYYRDELKGAGINPEITIQNKTQDNRSNPHWTQETDKIKKFLGYQNEDGIYAQWKDKYSLDVIGTSYCRSRTIPCTANEFDQMKAFKNARQVFVQSHYTWAEAIQKDMRDITLALKDYKYVKDAIDLCGALGLDINENELQRTAGVSLTIYQPENLASLIKSRRAKQDNKSVIEQFKKARQSAVATH